MGLSSLEALGKARLMNSTGMLGDGFKSFGREDNRLLRAVMQDIYPGEVDIFHDMCSRARVGHGQWHDIAGQSRLRLDDCCSSLRDCERAFSVGWISNLFCC